MEGGRAGGGPCYPQVKNAAAKIKRQGCMTLLCHVTLYNISVLPETFFCPLTGYYIVTTQLE